MLHSVRQPRPSSIIWELTDSVVTRFAWLENPAPAKNHLVEATKKGHRFEINLTAVKSLNLYLDERMIDYRKPVVVEVNGQIVLERILSPSLPSLCQTLQERGDPSFAFTSKISIPVEP